MNKELTAARISAVLEEIRSRHLQRLHSRTDLKTDQDRVGAPDGNQNAKKDYASKSAYKTAKNGGKHAGWYKRMKTMPPHLIEKSARSHEKTAEAHKDKIKNPSKYVSEWDKMKKKDQALLIRKWKTDIKRNQEQAYIEQGLLEEKQNGKR